jgi:signal peptidase II
VIATAVAVIVLLAADQATKLWTVATFPLNGPGEVVIPGALYFTYVQNTGAAFGLLRGVSFPLGPLTVDGVFVLGVVSLGVSLFIARYLWRKRGTLAWGVHVPLTLILAGALGNMIDRFRLGYVIDFIHVHIGWFNFPVFNVADSLVSVGAVMLLLFGRASVAPEEPGVSETETGQP